MKIFKILHFRSNWVNHPLKWDNYVLFWISYLLFASQLIWFLNDFFVTHDLGPVKPGPRAAKPIIPPYVENNYRIEVKITFMLIAYLVLLCEFFGEFSIFHFCRPLVDIYWHPLLIVFLSFFFFLGKNKTKLFWFVRSTLLSSPRHFRVFVILHSTTFHAEYNFWIENTYGSVRVRIVT